MAVYDGTVSGTRGRFYSQNTYILRIHSTNIQYWTIVPFRFTLCKKYFVYSRMLTSKYYNNFVISFFHRKSITRLKTENAGYQTIRMKYILNDMGTVIWVVHHVIVEKAGVLGCSAVWLGDCYLTFRTHVPPLSPKHPGKNPKNLLLLQENKLATNITFLDCVICSGCAVTFPLDVAYISL